MVKRSPLPVVPLGGEEESRTEAIPWRSLSELATVGEMNDGVGLGFCKGLSE